MVTSVATTSINRQMEAKVFNTISMKWIKEHIKVGDSVLQVGAGTGELAIAIAQYVGPQGCVVAFETDQDLLREAKKQAKRSQLGNILFMEGDVESLIILEERYDVVHCRLVLTYEKDIEKSLRLMESKRKPDGKFLFEETHNHPNISQDILPPNNKLSTVCSPLNTKSVFQTVGKVLRSQHQMMVDVRMLFENWSALWPADTPHDPLFMEQHQGFIQMSTSKCPVLDLSKIVVKPKERDPYLLPVGRADAKRLSAQEDLLEPYSLRWIEPYIRKPGIVFADVGCGHGGLTIAIAKRLAQNGGRVIAVDKSEAQLEIVRQKAKEANLTNIAFICADANELSQHIKAGECHVIHTRWVLAHVRDPWAVLSEMDKCLDSTQGVILCEEPGGDDYRCTPRKTVAFRLWMLAAKIQHLIARTDRAVALRLVNELFGRMGMQISYQTPPIVSETPFHNSRFREGIESAITKVKNPIIQAFGRWWVESLRAMEEDENFVITYNGFHQIAASRHLLDDLFASMSLEDSTT